MATESPAVRVAALRKQMATRGKSDRVSILDVAVCLAYISELERKLSEEGLTPVRREAFAAGYAKAAQDAETVVRDIPGTLAEELATFLSLGAAMRTETVGDLGFAWLPDFSAPATPTPAPLEATGE